MLAWIGLWTGFLDSDGFLVAVCHRGGLASPGGLLFFVRCSLCSGNILLVAPIAGGTVDKKSGVHGVGSGSVDGPGVFAGYPVHGVFLEFSGHQPA